mgnify:CR=1 FL=1
MLHNKYVEMFWEKLLEQLLEQNRYNQAVRMLLDSSNKNGKIISAKSEDTAEE